MIKFWSWIYRRTGFVHSSIKVAELQNLLDNMERIEERYLKSLKDGPEEDGFQLSLDDIVSIELGSYQAELKLYLDYKYFDYGDSKLETIKIRLKRLFGI